jgi:hypothetical protein
MSSPSDAVLEVEKVREVAAVFRSRDALFKAIDDLLLAGFDRADIDLVADPDVVQRRLGTAAVRAEDLADVPSTPRRPVVDPEATGRPSYHPSILLKLYIYSYLNWVQSSRRLEHEAGRNLEVMWLTGRLAPDHNTIADFRKDNGRASAPRAATKSADVIYYLALKKGFHQLLRGNAAAFDGLVYRGPGRAAAASQGKQALHRPLAEPRDLVQAEDIVVVVDSRGRIAVTSGKKEQIVSMAIEGHNISCRQIVVKAPRRGSLPMAEHGWGHYDAAIRPAAMMKIFHEQIACLFVASATGCDDFHRWNLGGKGRELPIARYLARNAGWAGALAMDQLQRQVRLTDDGVEEAIITVVADSLAQRDRAEIDALVGQGQTDRPMG